MLKVPYITENERDIIILENQLKDLILIEEQNITEGNFLIFGTVDDIPPMPEVFPTELELLQQKILLLENQLNAILG